MQLLRRTELLARHAMAVQRPLLAANKSPALTRDTSTWKLAAGGLRRKWKHLKQRTAWRYRTMQDRTTAVVFSADEQEEKEIHIWPRRGRRYLNDPNACHRVLSQVSAHSLNGILGATSPEDVSEYCTTMTDFMLLTSSPSMRRRILDVLTRERLQDLNILNRAVVVQAIQRCLRSPLHVEKKVLHSAGCNILRGTYGAELTLLKEHIHLQDEPFIDEPEAAVETDENILEATANIDEDNEHHDYTLPKAALKNPGTQMLFHPNAPPHSGDLSHLIYGNKDTTEVVHTMQHLAVEGLKVKESMPNLVKVVSDIDDTLFAGWLDRRYPLHIPYPGVSELYNRLSKGPGSKEPVQRDSVTNILEDLEDRGIDEDVQNHLPPSITFITARPRGWLGVGQYLTAQHLKSLGVLNATVLHGSVTGLVSSKRIAQIKLDNFRRFVLLFPEFQFVFVGDSGQGDALLASRLLQSFPEQVLATFIHDVTPHLDKTGDGGLKSKYQAQGVEFFSTYAGAALAAQKKDLISVDDLEAVRQATIDGLDVMPFDGIGGDELKAKRTKDLGNDLDAIEEYLGIAKLG